SNDVSPAEILGPDPTLTPGASSMSVSPTTLGQTICSTDGSTPARVSKRSEDEVYRRYRVSQDQQSRYAIDLLIPADLGGTTDVTNLWPRRAGGALDAATTRFESGLNVRVCDGQLALPDAQRVIATALTSRTRHVTHPRRSRPSTPPGDPALP